MGRSGQISPLLVGFDDVDFYGPNMFKESEQICFFKDLAKLGNYKHNYKQYFKNIVGKLLFNNRGVGVWVQILMENSII